MSRPLHPPLPVVYPTKLSARVADRGAKPERKRADKRPFSHRLLRLLRYNVRLLPARPAIKAITKMTRNRKNRIFAIPADAAATPPKPNTAAITAITKNTKAQ